MAGQKKKKNSEQPKLEKTPFPIEYEDIAKLTPEQIKELVQDLRIHQVELEAQNQELKQTQLQLQQSRDRYQALYDSIPAGCLTISKDLVIQDINVTAIEMLGTARVLLCGTPNSPILLNPRHKLRMPFIC